MTKAALAKPAETVAVQPSTAPTAIPVGESEDVLNWDVTIETPPVRPSGTLRVKLAYAGRAKPIPVDDP